jgi:carboxyl-terminal processing protease
MELLPTVKIKTKIILAICSVLLLLSFFVIGMYVGYKYRPSVEKVVGVTNKSDPAIPADFEPFWKVWNIIDKEYAGAKDVTNAQRVDGAIKGLVGSLGDPYSVYFPPQDSKDFKDTIAGSFEGIGMELGMKDKILSVIAPLKNTPSEKAGIRAGDKILKINDTVTSDMSIDKAVSLIRGAKGTPVRLTIFHDGAQKPVEISVVRDVINIPTIDNKLRPDGIYVISLYNFSASSANYFEKAVQDFIKSGSDKLVIDLRGNPGGYLDSAVSIASMFLPEGDTVVSENSGKEGDTPTIYRSKGYGLVDTKKVKIVILVDKGSASASEILAGALHEHGIAKLIGETTYGKGSVQKVMDVTDSTILKLTIAKWYTPNGISISKKGIEPDIKVVATEDDFKSGKDPALNRAASFLKIGK